MTGFLFCLLNSNRPIHEILQPVFIDQKSALDRQFKGMANEVFTYETLDYERIRLLRSIYNKINDVHKQLIIGFVCNRPIWPLGDWSKYPGVAWKMQNLQILQSQNPKKFEQQAKQVEDIFQLNAR